MGIDVLGFRVDAAKSPNGDLAMGLSAILPLPEGEGWCPTGRSEGEWLCLLLFNCIVPTKEVLIVLVFIFLRGLVLSYWLDVFEFRSIQDSFCMDLREAVSY